MLNALHNTKAALAACALGAGLAVISSWYGGGTAALLALLTIVVIAPLVWKWSRGELDLFEPLTLFCVAAAIFWVGRGAYILARHPPLRDYFPWPEERIEYLNAALIYTALGGLFMFIGYFGLPLSKRAEIQGPRDVWLPRRIAVVTISFFVVGIVTLGYIIHLEGGILSYLLLLPARGQIIERQAYLLLLTQWPKAAVLLWYTYLVSERRSSKLFWLALAIALVLSVAEGGRAPILRLIVAMMAIAHYLRRPARARWLVLALVLAFLLIAGGRYLRNLAWSGGEPGGLLDRLYGQGDFDHIDSLMIMMKNVPTELPYQLGKTYLSFLVSPIPRVVFPTKPYGATALFSMRLYPEYWYVGTGFQAGILGELYMNFGPLGVPLGMLIYGAAWRWMYEHLAPFRRGSRPGLVMIYGILLQLAFAPPLDFFNNMWILMSVLIPSLIALKFCTRPARLGSTGETTS